MQNNDRPEKWWSSTPKVFNGKFLVVAILPDGQETTELFSLEELAAHLTQRALDGAKTVLCTKCNHLLMPGAGRCELCGLDDADWWDCECGIANHPSWQACQFCKYPRRQ